jgi:hypothetical protein
MRSRVLMSDGGPRGCSGGNGVIAEVGSSASRDPPWPATIDYDNVGTEANLYDVVVAQGEALRFAVSNNGDNRCDETRWTPAIAYTAP